MSDFNIQYNQDVVERTELSHMLSGNHDMKNLYVGWDGDKLKVMIKRLCIFYYNISGVDDGTQILHVAY